MDDNYKPDVEKMSEMITKQMNVQNMTIPNDLVDIGIKHCLNKCKFCNVQLFPSMNDLEIERFTILNDISYSLPTDISRARNGANAVPPLCYDHDIVHCRRTADRFLAKTSICVVDLKIHK